MTATHYLLGTVLLKAYPLAIFFAVVRFFPFEITNPVESVGNPIGYIVVWTVLALLVGYGEWRTARQVSG